jgi:hypothetical protein
MFASAAADQKNIQQFFCSQGHAACIMAA